MVTVQEFVNFTTSDLKCTNKSEFPLNINKYRQFVNQLNENIENDKTSLSKIKKGVKTIYNSGTTHCQNEICFSELLEKLSQNEEDSDFDVDGDKIGSGLCKFAVVMRDLSTKYKQLMQNLNSLLVYPMDMFLKSYLKHDARKPFEKALKDYEAKAEKLKKDRLNALNKENASTIYRPNGDDLFDFSEDLERERRVVQLQLCEFLIKVNEMKARKGAELVQQLIDFYRAQTNYFKDSLSMMEHMGLFMNDLVSHIDEIKSHHTDDIQLLSTVRKDLKSTIEKNTKAPTTTTSASAANATSAGPSQQQVGYSLHQPQGNKAYGTTKDGYLLKKSDGMVKRVWQKRRVKVCDQNLLLYHGDDSKPPVTLPMLTCHIKHPISGAGGGGGGNDAESSCCFELISNNRKYNFRAEDEKTLEEWLSVLSNAKAAVFEQAMSLDNNEDEDDDNLSNGSNTNPNNNFMSINSNVNYSLTSTAPLANNNNNNISSLYTPNNLMTSSIISYTNRHGGGDGDLSPSHYRKAIIKTIRKLEGNEKCVDCGAPDPDWVSVNLGVLICLNCCGVHRELGVHLSRTQSLKMDTFYLSQLLLPRFVGNKMFNSVFEATLPDNIKPVCSDTANRNDSSVTMEQRRNYILSKYVDRKFVDKFNSSNLSYLKHDLLQAIQNMDIKSLLQAYAEGADMMNQFTLSDDQDIGPLMNTCIHQVLQENETSNNTPSTVVGSGNFDLNTKKICLYDLNWEDDGRLKNNVALLVILEFILQNTTSASLKRVNAKGDTILHQAVRSKQLDATKLILRSGSIFSELLWTKNNDNHTANDLVDELLSTDPSYSLFSDLFNSAISANRSANNNSSGVNNTSTHSDSRDHYNELLDELSIDWALFVPNATGNATSAAVFHNTNVGSDNKVTTDDSTTTRSQLIPSSTDHKRDKLGAFSYTSNNRQEKHNRSESMSSTKSDASAYVNFNNCSPMSYNSINISNHNEPIDKPDERKHSIHSITTTNSMASNNSHHSIGGYKAFLSYNPDQKIGIKSSTNPWKESTTLPRKKSLKGPAPEPPQLMHHKSAVTESHQAPVKPKSSHHNTLSSIIKPKSSSSSKYDQTPKPSLAPKPRGNSILDKNKSQHKSFYENEEQSYDVKPQPKSRSTYVKSHHYTSSDYATGSNTVIYNTSSVTHVSTTQPTSHYNSQNNDISVLDYSNATLPRNMHSIIKDSKPTNNSNMKSTSQLSHSSDHIDVLLDVLEEPDKPLNAEEVHIKEDRMSKQNTAISSNKSPNSKSSTLPIALSAGDRTVAQYKCEAEHPDELSFSRGDIIVVANNSSDDGWWEGYVESNPSKIGLFPGNFVKKKL